MNFNLIYVANSSYFQTRGLADSWTRGLEDLRTCGLKDLHISTEFVKKIHSVLPENVSCNIDSNSRFIRQRNLPVNNFHPIKDIIADQQIPIQVGKIHHG